MNYSEEECMVRVDLWKESGKWQETLAMRWEGFFGNDFLIHEAFRSSLERHLPNIGSYEGMRATCLEPYHEHSHPISIVI